MLAFLLLAGQLGDRHRLNLETDDARPLELQRLRVIPRWAAKKEGWQGKGKKVRPVYQTLEDSFSAVSKPMFASRIFWMRQSLVWEADNLRGTMKNQRNLANRQYSK